jgi:hypothetical protein
MHLQQALVPVSHNLKKLCNILFGDHFHETMSLLFHEGPFRQIFDVVGIDKRNAARMGDATVEAEICTGTGHKVMP